MRLKTRHAALALAIATSACGAIVPITAQAADGSTPLFRLLAEHAISINTAAAGGNASLMTLD